MGKMSLSSLSAQFHWYINRPPVRFYRAWRPAVLRRRWVSFPWWCTLVPFRKLVSIFFMLEMETGNYSQDDGNGAGEDKTTR